ncbi:MAG: nicotinate-nucleotide--dimethylbenzimidazole phosphoribosyltransferase [bacterium]|nr:nicotinate-nucleotide--dimethylbenzimidazole phosphoribosyltransferase [bacterium]
MSDPIPRPDALAHGAAASRQRTLTKPADALGRLEELACWFAARQGRGIPVALVPAITVFAADHGVAARGVSAYPAEVTAQMVANFARGGAAINVLARHLGARLTVVDAGVAAPLSGLEGVVHAKIRAGSRDLATEPALTADEVAAAQALGAARAAADVAAGANLLIAGDMGIGNTTAAACLVCALTGESADDIVGAGTGIDATARSRKVAIVASAVSRARSHAGADGWRWLAYVGGLEIAAIAGYQHAAAARGVPMLLDGFVATAAALAVRAIAPRAVDWMLASHRSAERGHGRALRHLGLEPLVDLGMRLGEGSGAAVVVPLLQAALALHAGMATFTDARVTGPAR